MTIFIKICIVPGCAAVIRTPVGAKETFIGWLCPTCVKKFDSNPSKTDIGGFMTCEDCKATHNPPCENPDFVSQDCNFGE